MLIYYTFISSKSILPLPAHIYIVFFSDLKSSLYPYYFSFINLQVPVTVAREIYALLLGRILFVRRRDPAGQN